MIAAARRSAIVDARGAPIVVNRAPGSQYEGATGGKRAKYWTAPGTGPNNALSGSLARLRNRSRAAERNNPWLWQAIDRLVSNEVGVGVTLRSKAADGKTRDQLDALWTVTREQLDPAGVNQFGGLQALAVRARRVSGEVFLRRVRRRMDSGLALPFQVQVLEPDHVSEQDNRTLPNGNRVKSGIEFNRLGERVAYWMHRDHPGDGEYAGGFNAVRVPARDVVHHYIPTRPGQIRGEPQAARSLLPAHTFDQYEDSELVRKQTRAPYTGFLTRAEYRDDQFTHDPFTGQPLQADGDGVPSLDVEAGTILNGFPGEELTMFDGDKGGEGYMPYARAVLMKIAAGHGVPYELLSGDWSQVNDRLVRAIMNEFRRSISAAQDHALIFQLCNGIWGWFVDAAVFAGKVSAPGYAGNRAPVTAVHARPHAWEYIHPVQDIDSKLKKLSARLTSRQSLADEMPGPSAEEIDQQIEADPFYEQAIEGV